MNNIFFLRDSRRRGSALLLTMVMTTVALVTVASVLTYSRNTARINYRFNQYQRAVAAAEGATEKLTSRITRDYLNGGETLVTANLANYRQTIPTSSDSPYWSDWQFNNANGNTDQTFVGIGAANSYVVLDTTYGGLQGFATSYTLISNARQPALPQDVVGGVAQQLKLARIPIFQFAMYSSGNMEISCGQNFNITGRVHSNGQLYVEPGSLLTFQSDVTAVGLILFERDPLDTRTPSTPAGSVVYQAQKQANVPAMTLPIGTSNSPTAVREIIQPPPPLESPSSSMGQVRYYNQADMVLVVTTSGTNTLVSGTSGNFNAFTTGIPTNDLKMFVSTTNRFTDAREGKTVLPIDINVAALRTWSATNASLRTALGGADVASIYVWDRRILPGTNLAAVRVTKGTQLPSRGLTIATADPLYVLGNYNQFNPTNLGTANTSTTLPASFAADAVTILSTNWTDANSTQLVAARLAGPTTVNAAILAGSVDTVLDYYSGGMENFPRFLETWGALNIFTYNGSMVKMFPSLYATNCWGKANVYGPPARDWAYDVNFNNPTLLPPLTPSLLKVVRSQWATLAPNSTNTPATF